MYFYVKIYIILVDTIHKLFSKTQELTENVCVIIKNLSLRILGIYLGTTQSNSVS